MIRHIQAVAEEDLHAPDIEVHAAGVVPWRRSRSGEIEVLLVHRPQYDDWTFPKGKRTQGETDEQTALREVEEETGLQGTLGLELPATRYLDRRRRHKRVRYWGLQPNIETASPQNEVDAVAWLRVVEAARRLTYERDVAVLRALELVVARSS